MFSSSNGSKKPVQQVSNKASREGKLELIEDMSIGNGAGR